MEFNTFKTTYNIRANLVDDTVETAYRNTLDEIVTETLNTKEEGIRKALIELGWTPPEGETK